MKTAVLSMDIEDWYHLAYFDRATCDQSKSMLDGVEIYAEVLAANGIETTFFVLGELARGMRPLLLRLREQGHEIAAHGWNHVLPMALSAAEFSADVERTKAELEEVIGSPVVGYRAPCFSLDRSRLDLLKQAGYLYDSSRIEFSAHPLYHTLDVTDFDQVVPGIYRQDGFYEFEVSTLRVATRDVPVSGGGYVRILPWSLMKRWIRQYGQANQLYVFYIHPFELSKQSSPPLPHATTLLNRVRFSLGRSLVRRRIELIVKILRDDGFTFKPFAQIAQDLSGNSELANL